MSLSELKHKELLNKQIENIDVIYICLFCEEEIKDGEEDINLLIPAVTEIIRENGKKRISNVAHYVHTKCVVEKMKRIYKLD